mgnify:CR=1 FL=1
MIRTERYGYLADGREVTLYTITNRNGLRVRLIDYGAITVSVELPDRHGELEDVTLGYDTLQGWLDNRPYFGATIGRCANRIARGRFTLDGRTYRLATNDGQNHLHGGVRGFDRMLWNAEPVETSTARGIRFGRLSPDGEEGYPGNLQVVATHWLTDDNEFRIEYSATTDQPTIVNLAHHSYWNLAGAAAGDILRHELRIYAAEYTPTRPDLIPTGEVAPVAGTPLDFNALTAVGARIAQVAGGYDHNFVLGACGSELRPAAQLYEPTTGRLLEIHTDQPAIQFYSGNFLDGSISGKYGVRYHRHRGLCLETQHYPDSPNHTNFPSIVLRPGQTYRHTMVHRFATGG